MYRGVPAAPGLAAMPHRIPSGHPEGYLEAFGQLYSDFARAWRGGEGVQLPGIEDGLQGMAFIEAVLRSHRAGNRWVVLGDAGSGIAD